MRGSVRSRFSARAAECRRRRPRQAHSSCSTYRRMLDPRGYATVEIVLHEASGDVKRTVAVDASGKFDLDRIDPSTSVEIEATLRSSTGAAVGYGRTRWPRRSPAARRSPCRCGGRSPTSPA